MTNKRINNRVGRRKLIAQKFFGLVLIAMSILLIYIASQGTTVEDRDATAVLLTAPMGLYLLLTKTVNIF